MPKLEQRFDYVKIGLASPDRIRQWGERTLPNGTVVGEVTTKKISMSPGCNFDGTLSTKTAKPAGSKVAQMKAREDAKA